MKAAVTRVFIVSKVYYRDNSLLKMFRTTLFTQIHRHPYNVERASSATSLRYDRTTRNELKEGQWIPDRPGNRLWLDRTSSRKLLPSMSRLINAINARSRPQRAIFVPRPKFRNTEIYVASCPRAGFISEHFFYRVCAMIRRSKREALGGRIR